MTLHPLWWRAVVMALAWLLAGCAAQRPVVVPMPSIEEHYFHWLFYRTKKRQLQRQL